MTLVRVLGVVVAVDGIALAATALLLIGPATLASTARALPDRLREVALPVGVLAVVLLVNGLIRDAVTELSWIVGVPITHHIYGFEGNFVPWIQSFASPGLTLFFSYAYVFGYVYLLVFPLVAYVALEDSQPLRSLAIAYSVNYVLGLVCYVAFIAYGPRNLLPGSVESLLYLNHPQFQFLTSEVNANTNVFPSLHTSLSTTVAGLAYYTRDTYPAWFAIATALAVSIVGATMYLGIHWVTDVLGGFVLAAIALWVARRYGDRDLLT